MQKNYYAIITANVRYDPDLPPNAKLLYGEITALCNEKGYCWASNAYFSELYKVNKVTISRWIAQLIEKGYITSEMQYKEGTKEILNRYIRISDAPNNSNVNTPIDLNVNTPINENVKDNNTSINTTLKKYIYFADTVRLTQDEYDRLVTEFGKDTVDYYIDRLDEWQTNNPKKQKKDHNKTIRVWIKDGTKKKSKKAIDWEDL